MPDVANLENRQRYFYTSVVDMIHALFSGEGCDGLSVLHERVDSANCGWWPFNENDQKPADDDGNAEHYFQD